MKLYIARCMVDMEDERCLTPCWHCKPHEVGDEDKHYMHHSDTYDECCCIPVPLSYYMKKVLEKDKK